LVGPAAAHSPANCFGTNLSSEYAIEADVWLRSPVVDLTTAGGATLRLFMFRDIEVGFDKGRVAVLDAANNSVLAVLEEPVDGVVADWEQFVKPLPAGALGKTVRFEFRLTSDDLQNFAGWYIDDVIVTVP
jgi:bacillopeptidase F